MTEIDLTDFELSMFASPKPLNMYSKSAIDLAQNAVIHKRSKHIRTKYRCICEQVGGGIERPTADVAANMMTNALLTKHIKLVVRLGRLVLYQHIFFTASLHTRMSNQSQNHGSSE